MEKLKAELEAQGARIIAASVDDLEHAREIASDLTFPVAFGVTRADADRLGAWWGEQRGGIIQPAEFLLAGNGKVLHAMYATGPIGRLSAEEVLNLLKAMNSR